MSDEFNLPGRTFSDGHDTTWTALHKNDYTNNALHYYSEENVKTGEGYMQILTEAKHTSIVGFDDETLLPHHDTKYFKSGMVQSWNKFCFTGGIIEASVILPGTSETAGLWPAFWLLGNLARHTYVGSSSNIWPWSMTSTCDESLADSQKISACLKTSHYGLKPGVGRGAPEMDIFEVQPGPVKHNTNQFKDMSVGQPFSSTSLQIAPGKSVARPGNGAWPAPWEWYNEFVPLMFGPNTSMNIAFFGTYNHFKDAPAPTYDYWSDAVSQNRQLSETHFERPHTFRLEWEPPSDIYEFGYLHWFLDGELILAINGTSIAPVTHAEIPSEPSYIIFNTAVSKEWGFPTTCPMGCACKKYDCLSSVYDDTCGFPTDFCKMITSVEESGTEPGSEFKIDWVRVYQDKNNEKHKVGCSTPERPTREWIEGHHSTYMQEGDETPLKKVAVGGGACDSKIDAKTVEKEKKNERGGKHGGSPGRPAFFQAICGGGSRGECVDDVCVCVGNSTGPYCLDLKKRDAVAWDLADTLGDVGESFALPGGGVLGVFLVVAGGGFAVIAGAILRERKGRAQYVVIPDREGDAVL